MNCFKTQGSFINSHHYIVLVGLALGSEKCKLEVKISRYSKPNLTTEVKLLEAATVNFRSEI